MRVLVVGGTGMAGHKLWQVLSRRFDTWATVRTPNQAAVEAGLLDAKRLLQNVDVFHLDTIEQAIARVAPDVVVNATGVIKQSSMVKDSVATITINALFPHQLAAMCCERGARLIHISTDCVFSGRKGNYNENDIADAEDLYGRSKLLGEVTAVNCLTLRTSLIGPELGTRNGLIEWFLGNRGKGVKGYTHAIFSGFPTIAFADLVATIIGEHAALSGLYHLSSDPVSKYDLLRMARDIYNAPIEIEPCADLQIDRSLDSTRFRSITGFAPQPWPDMMALMAADTRTSHNDKEYTWI
jgi:dTDP-4-dehydrorhamnose reductase